MDTDRLTGTVKDVAGKVEGGIGFLLAMLMRPSSRPQPQRWRY